jgi:hypothetical protein
VTKLNKLQVCAWAISSTLAAASSPAACAADLTEPGPRAIMPPPYVYGGFNPIFDPRCRIVPQPEASLYGETARFRPTAICQSRGLYADSVVIP